MTVFVHDCLDQIFDRVLKKESRIRHCLRAAGEPTKSNDPFKLYCGYIDIVKPIDYETDMKEYKEKISELEVQLNGANEKADAIQSACETYL